VLHSVILSEASSPELASRRTLRCPRLPRHPERSRFYQAERGISHATAHWATPVNSQHSVILRMWGQPPSLACPERAQRVERVRRSAAPQPLGTLTPFILCHPERSELARARESKDPAFVLRSHLISVIPSGAVFTRRSEGSPMHSAAPGCPFFVIFTSRDPPFSPAILG